MIEIKDFPLPPSNNALYANRHGGGRQKSIAYHKYRAEVEAWKIRNYYKLLHIKHEFEEMFIGQAIQIDHIFYFKKERILCKNGDVKKNDTWNYTKGLHDVLAELLGIDDRLFWEGSVKKIPTDEIEGVDIKLEIIETPKTYTTQKS